MVYVKPFGTLPQSLINEWIGGRLAQWMGLPVADMDIVEVPQLLADNNRRNDWNSFKAGLGFGSYVGGASVRDLQLSDIAKLNAVQLAEVFLFDYWIQNADRQIGLSGGNPNTIIFPHREEFYLIDHDNAFDEINIKLFNEWHIGRHQKEYWLSKIHQKSWLEKVDAALEQLDEFWGELPEEWLHSDLDISSESSYTVSPIRDILRRPLTDPESFWSPILS